jgi:hypothetical protein
MKAPDGSEGRWVRCSRCRAKIAVPGGAAPAPGGGADFGSEVDQALAWQDRLSRRRAEGEPRRWLGPRTEQWLMEHGLWKPAGVATMSVFGVIGLIGLAVDSEVLFEVCGFLFLTGLGVFVYGHFEREKVGEDAETTEE